MDSSCPYQYVVDQGGASFTAHLFHVGASASSGADTPLTPGAVANLPVVTSWTAKARTLLCNVADYPSLAALLGSDPYLAGLVDTHGGTLEDYSDAPPELYPKVAALLALCWNIHLQTMVETHCKRGTVAADIKKTVRQTGKIRGKLLQAANQPAKQAWDAAVQAALGYGWDYSLIATEEEAYLEGTSFFHLNDLSHITPQPSDPTSVAGIGVGSSSTQLYTLDRHGALRVAFDSFTGCKPTAAQKKAAEEGAPKAADQFQEQFARMFERALGGNLSDDDDATAAAAIAAAPGAAGGGDGVQATLTKVKEEEDEVAAEASLGGADNDSRRGDPSPARRLYVHGAFGYTVNELFKPSLVYNEKATVRVVVTERPFRDCWRKWPLIGSLGC
jgi:hypothetical protein